MTDSGFKYYHYDPSLAAAVIFMILFILTTALHLYQLLRTRTWYFIPFVIGGFRKSTPLRFTSLLDNHQMLNVVLAVEWIGYVGRIVGSEQTPNWTLPPYIVQVLFLLLAPVLFAASIYMELARIILVADGEAHALVRPNRLTMTFVLGDVFSFLLQSAGGGLMSTGSHGKSQSTVKMGQKVVVGGLLVQILFFGCFVFVAVLFQLRIRKAPTSQSQSALIPWRKHLNALYAASILILIRSVFRVVEFVQGNDGYILSHEWFLYVFDSVLMLGVMVIFNVIHPSEVKALLRGGKMSRGGLKLYEVKVGH